MRGYCAIGIVGSKTPENVGTLWRSAHVLRASFIFTVGARYKRQPTDTMNSAAHVPLFEFDEIGQLPRPAGSELVAVEMELDALSLNAFIHPQRAIYVLGSEDRGLDDDTLGALDYCVHIPSAGPLNVAVAGSIVLYDRLAKARG